MDAGIVLCRGLLLVACNIRGLDELGALCSTQLLPKCLRCTFCGERVGNRRCKRRKNNCRNGNPAGEPGADKPDMAAPDIVTMEHEFILSAIRFALNHLPAF